MDTEQTVKLILHRMQRIYRNAIGTRRRGDWLRAHAINNSEWIYSVSADDVISHKIPSRVAGEFARAKLFCKIASEINFECFVILTANTDDLADGCEHIHGFPLIAINIDGVLRSFNPGSWPLSFIPGCVAVGRLIRSVKNWMPCRICAVIPRDEFLKINTYKKLHDLYIKDA